MAALRILCVHGVGDHHTDLNWQDQWKAVITDGLRRWDPQRSVQFDFLLYDELFAEHPISASGSAEALAKLIGSGVVNGLSDAADRVGESISNLFRRRRGFFGGLSEQLRWSAGMVVQWVENDALRRATRQKLSRKVRSFQPDVILAHSLGSLITYDTYSLERSAGDLDGRTVVTFGSQIGNPFVRGSFGGRIAPLPARRWFHLFNQHDSVFTAPLRVEDPAFEQVETHFDIDGIMDHAATEYLGHANTLDRVWFELGGGRRAHRSLRQAARNVRAAQRKPNRRALLVGINEYPDPGDRLAGCVNDVFLMSSLLQETGFDPEDIRVVLDDRATARGIMDRLDWLLDGATEGDERFFFYSGHGAQIPTYGFGDTVDGVDECLVAWDFDWDRDTAVTDDQFFEMYSQLHYGVQFVTVFDCCHSGGMRREGGPRVRGLTPPDDVRHRALRWDEKHQMWTERDLPVANRDLNRQKNEVSQAYLGVNGSTRRLGRAIPLRTLSQRSYDRERRQRGHHGPYLPVIFQACQEDQLAEEYRHGVVSYGAFTYSLVKTLRDRRGQKKDISFRGLVRAVNRELEDLGYTQVPAVHGPSAILNTPVPYRKQRRRRR